MQWYCVRYMERLRLHQQRRNGKKPGRNIWTGVGYLTVSAGKVSFDGMRQERARSCDSGQGGRRDFMIIQPERGTRNINEKFYEMEARQIAMLNEIFGEVELTKGEMRTLVWLAGWEEWTIVNKVDK